MREYSQDSEPEPAAPLAQGAMSAGRGVVQMGAQRIPAGAAAA